MITQQVGLGRTKNVRPILKRYESLMKQIAILMLMFLACSTLGSEVPQPIRVQSYMEVSIDEKEQYQWKYFLGAVKPDEKLRHIANQVTLEIDLTDSRNADKVAYLNRVIDSSVMELEVRRDHQLIVFTEIKPLIKEGVAKWVAEYSAEEGYNVVLWFRYKYTDKNIPMAEPIPLNLLEEWKAVGNS